MHRILHITNPDDPLTATVTAAADGRFEIESTAGDAVPPSLSGFDAVLIGDTALSAPLPVADGKKPELIQLTRGHHRDIDAAALAASGVVVAGASPVLAPHIAAHALSLAVAVGAQDGPREMQSREAVAALLEENGRQLSGLTVGIVGFGRIGRATAERYAAAGARIIYCDVRTAAHGSAAASGARRSTLDLLLSQSDIVSLHVQWGPTSNPLISSRELRLMGRGSVLVNTADARLVDTGALAKALGDGRIGGAGLDVEESGLLQLAELPNVVHTAYTGARTEAADDAVARFVVDNIESALSGGEPNALPEGLIEIVDFPRAGDPAFWSSKMAPRV